MLVFPAGSAGSSPGEQDAEASELHLRPVSGDGHRHLSLHQPGNHWIHVLRSEHRWQHHSQPAQLLVRQRLHPDGDVEEPQKCSLNAGQLVVHVFFVFFVFSLIYIKRPQTN